MPLLKKYSIPDVQRLKGNSKFLDECFDVLHTVRSLDYGLSNEVKRDQNKKPGGEMENNRRSVV